MLKLVTEKREKENKKWVIISLGYYYICNNYGSNIGTGPPGFLRIQS